MCKDENYVIGACILVLSTVICRDPRGGKALLPVRLTVLRLQCYIVYSRVVVETRVYGGLLAIVGRSSARVCVPCVLSRVSCDKKW